VLDSFVAYLLTMGLRHVLLHRFDVTIYSRIAIAAGIHVAHLVLGTRYTQWHHLGTARLIYVDNCRVFSLPMLDGHLTSPYERVRVRNGTLNDSSSLKLYDIIDRLARGTSCEEVGHQHLSSRWRSTPMWCFNKFTDLW
jgi:hypothetical protein